MHVRRAKVINCPIPSQLVFHLFLLNLCFQMCGDQLQLLLAGMITM
jgi:hypothetical protein